MEVTSNRVAENEPSLAARAHKALGDRTQKDVSARLAGLDMRLGWVTMCQFKVLRGWKACVDVLDHLSTNLVGTVDEGFASRAASKQVRVAGRSRGA